MATPKWRTYEEVAEYLLNQFASEFNLGKVEGKQLVIGESGTNWELDAVGCKEDDKIFMVIECKRHTVSGIPQAIVGSLAWTIHETGASGGIIVSPLGLQDGAKKVAKHANIIEVKMDENSTKTDYILSFLNRIHIGISDRMPEIRDSFNIKVIDRDGNVVQEYSDQ